ncbi:sigma-70 family RNA polymerase sigma factor [Exiguobacterium sp. SH3S2]|uniref:RNA polymerase sigma factor n=1 Tax=unclassified Exiguobacterium TaxID=2644629 RepID=UPI00103D46E6|nr:MULTISPECIES: sigma-70 family RNA polymerase sigma factor [unclassified Exiguobacterium]TCI46074.1 sigma-70 family RNA polymerase sigma factor [Exiguobacterium sp. SH3S3]TCI61162.1 sigma-70 family RNA polymerase sigma factor [Exiguobacterium sp. SH3S2]
MDDQAIIDLYFARSEQAIAATAEKYGAYCYTISYNILHSREDADECVNDTYMKAWHAIPPTRPRRFAAYLAKLVRNVSLHTYEKAHAKKRGGSQVPLVIDELEHCLSSSKTDDTEVIDLLNDFLEQLPRETRQIFMARYFQFQSIKEIAKARQLNDSKVKMVLLRTRNDLKQALVAEGVAL